MFAYLYLLNDKLKEYWQGRPKKQEHPEPEYHCAECKRWKKWNPNARIEHKEKEMHVYIMPEEPDKSDFSR